MRKHPWLQLRGRVWYMRAIVPRDIVQSLGRREVWKSLRTDNREVANIRIQSEAARQVLEFEKMRQINGRPSIKPDKSYIEFVAFQYANDLEKARAARLPTLLSAAAGNGLDQERDEIKHLFEFYHSALKENDFAKAYTEVATIVKAKKLDLRPGSEEWNYLSHLVLRAICRELRIDSGEIEGTFQPVYDQFYDSSPGKSRPPGSFVTLEKAVQKYMNEKSSNWGSKTKLYYEAGFSLLLRHFGASRRLNEITRDDLREYRDLMKQLPPNCSKFKKYEKLSLKNILDLARKSDMRPMARPTLVKYVGTASSLFEFAADESYIESNPARGLVSAIMPKGALSKVGKKKRYPFTPDELSQIFGSKIYNALAVDDAMRWIPLLALYQGLRMNEICQMETGDIILEDNVWCMKVTVELSSSDDAVDEEETEDTGRNRREKVKKSVKTLASLRTIPIHQTLIDAGFLNLVERVRLAGCDRVFWQVNAAATGYYSDVFSKHYTRYLKEINVHSKKKTFHSFRHTWRDACRDARIPDPIVHQLGGWTKSDVGTQYGVGYRMSDLAAELKKVRYQSVVPQVVGRGEMMKSPMQPWRTVTRPRNKQREDGVK